MTPSIHQTLHQQLMTLLPNYTSLRNSERLQWGICECSLLRESSLSPLKTFFRTISALHLCIFH